MEFTTIKGFRDILPDETPYWQKVEQSAREVFKTFGFNEIRTPILEYTELFARTIGTDTDIVSKEMYTLTDSKGRGLTLRPEATASVARALIQNRLYQQGGVQKLFCIGPMFRHERPQKGRFRQFHQINAELFGDRGPKSDAEIIYLAVSLLEAFELRNLTLHLNSIGCPKCRPGFRQKLREYLVDRSESLCANCKRRAETNPLRVFDCKVEGCKVIVQEAPVISEHLCEECRDHFSLLREYIQYIKMEIVLDPRLVRGLDYYTRTTFEIQTEQLGAQNAVVGGGRYDGLVEQIGGPDLPGIGFAIGMERVMALLMERQGRKAARPDLFVAALGSQAEKMSFTWAQELRKRGFWIEQEYAPKSLKAQMKRADRLGCKRVLIVGEREIETGMAIIRDMETKEQKEVSLDNILEALVSIIMGENADNAR
ncbi:MAG: histidine--tRNA ligase [Deltaproteobacteria bacterium]|nr:MAG: histidine--tRNA ligase [Deltaproteobacteria bacterium]